MNMSIRYNPHQRGGPQRGKYEYGITYLNRAMWYLKHPIAGFLGAHHNTFARLCNNVSLHHG